MLLSKTTLGLATLASKEESRYTLKAVAITAREAVVTNGHYLVKATHPAGLDPSAYPVTAGLDPRSIGENETVLVSSEAALTALKAIPKKNSIPVLANAALGSDGNLYVNTLDSVSTARYQTEGSFPNWQAVIPQGEPKAEIAFSASYLVALGKFFEKYGNGSERGNATSVRLTIYSKDTAARFDAAGIDGQELTAVLMPIRMETGSFPSRPDEVRAEEIRKAEAERIARETAERETEPAPIAAD